MKTKDFETFIKLKEEISLLADKIFHYVKEKYVDQLQFGRLSEIDGEDLYESGLEIKYYYYGYDIYDCDHLPTIPIQLLENERSWKKFIDDYYGTKIAEEEKKKQRELQAKEEKERELYNKLKEKYESESEAF